MKVVALHKNAMILFDDKLEFFGFYHIAFLGRWYDLSRDESVRAGQVQHGISGSALQRMKI